MEKYNSTNRNFGYNLRFDSSSGMVCSEETKTKMSISGKNRYIKFPELKNKISIKISEV